MPPRLRRLCTLVVAGFLACTLASFRASSAGQNPQSDAVRATSAETLRAAQTIFIRTKSVYFKPAALEQSLLDRDEVQYWGLVISRDETDADLIIEVDRKLFTNRFVYSVLDPRTNRVLLSGKIGSLGGTVEDQIASGFVKRMRPFRALAATAAAPAHNK
ncbi:MAG TPA: hypothetical protein VGX24_10235 [Pyrinomonadaceae bacterium]|jgi:hypothetical protein|nr:hypothetical protein [Pyrinomonadaceae bacterium]